MLAQKLLFGMPYESWNIIFSHVRPPQFEIYRSGAYPQAMPQAAFVCISLNLLIAHERSCVSNSKRVWRRQNYIIARRIGKPHPISFVYQTWKFQRRLW